MAIHAIKKGLDLSIPGDPEQRIDGSRVPRHVALVADDYIGLHPTLRVQAGDQVLRGQPLFEDAHNPGVIFTSPATGTVSAVNSGEDGAFQSVVIALDPAEPQGVGGQVAFGRYTGNAPAGLRRDQIQALLLESGLWTSLRTRPFGKVPPPNTEPAAIFVTAIDTNPHAPNPELVIQGHATDFERGLVCVAKLSEGRTFLCKARGASIPANPNTGIQIEEFDGGHPAGTVGVHIHRLAPVSRAKTVWHLNYQDVIAIGKLFGSGTLCVDRVISLAGPSVERPRLLRTLLGASTADLVEGELKPGEPRVMSGPVTSGRTAFSDVSGYLGRYHHQLCVMPEQQMAELARWIYRGTSIRSLLYAIGSKVFRGNLSIVTNGMCRAVSPIDVVTASMLRAILNGDAAKAERLGVLELDEEDLALCSLMDGGRRNFGPQLREILNRLHGPEGARSLGVDGTNET